MSRYKKNRLLELSYLPLLLSAVITILVIRGIYIENQGILKDKLRERLVAIASTAALQFDPEAVRKIKNEEDLHSKELREVLNIMNKIRFANTDLRYLYIWRKSLDPSYLEFVADAEMLEPIDVDGNGEINDDEIPPVPGEKYGVDQIPEYKDLFDHPLAQNDFIVDKWGTFMSGYAPIRDRSGTAIAVLGIDVEVGDFNKIIRATLVPFVVLTILLLLLLTSQTIALIRIWKSRVNLLQELDRQKDELLGIVSHQLTKPITAIRWDLESFLEGDLGQLTDQQKKEHEVMRGQAVHLADLTSMILDVSRIQLGKVQLDPQPLDLDAFFKEILDLIEPSIKQKKQNFVKNMPAKLPKVLLDKRYTRMTIENLLTNAVKYTPEGGKVTLDINIDDKNVMHLSVSDTGVGIPKAEQDKIFGKMYRASNVRNTAEGNGFGLYVAKGAIEAQGGKLWFTSEEEKGTTFTMELPLREAK